MYSIYAGDELLYSDVCPLETRKVTSPTLKMGVDEAGSLEFTVSEVNKCYTKLLRMKTIITVKKFDIPIWDGRILNESRDFNNNKKIYTEGALAFLNDTTQPIKEYKNRTLGELVTAFLEVHNNLVEDERKLYYGGVADSYYPDQIEYWVTSYEYTVEAIKNLAEYLECHYIVKKVQAEPNSENYVNKIFFFREYYGKTNQTITFGKNLMDYTEQYDLSKLATVLLPLAETDRESADEPNIIGTDIDLTNPLPYGQRGNYGVFMPLTKGVALRSELNIGNQQYTNVPIPPYRNKLNVLLSEVDTEAGTYTVKGADLIGIPTTGHTAWTIPDYIRVWQFRGDVYYQSIDDAKNASLNPHYISNAEVDFKTFPGALDQGILKNDSPLLFDVISAHSKYNEQLYEKTLPDGTLIESVWRTHDVMDSIAFENVIDDYGILTGRHHAYQTTIVEIDISTYKTVYLTASNPLKTGGIMTMSLWTRSLASESDPAYVKRPDFVLDTNPMGGDDKEGFIYASYQTGRGKFYPAFAVSAGYELPDDSEHQKVSDLQLNQGLLPYILDPDRYSLVKEYDVGTCFSRKIDLNYDIPEGTSNRALLVISSLGVPNLTIVSEEDKQKDSTIAIGMNTEGIDVSETYPKRIYDPDHNTWISGFGPDNIYVVRQQVPPEDPLPYSGYGVLTKVTDGVRLLTEQELNELNYNAHLNIFYDGEINVSISPPANSIIKAVPQTEEDYQEYKVCVVTVRNSYIDHSGRKYPNSIFISSEMNGKNALYAIFEFTDGNGGNSYVTGSNGQYEAWDSVPPAAKPQNMRTLCKQPIEFGKYVSGRTVLDGKKITMPYSRDPDRLLMVCIASYGEAPKVYAHDPKLENSVRYLTIASVNNGSIKLAPDSSNIFGTNFEHGDITDQNGSKSNTVTRNVIRTVDDIDVPADGPYAFTFQANNVKARVHIYGNLEDYLGYVDYAEPDPYIMLPYLYRGYRLRITAIKGDGTGPIATNDISNVMIWTPENSSNMLFTQGSLLDPQDHDSIEIDTTVTNSIATSDYYYVKDIECDLDIRVVLDTAKMPAVYNDGTESRVITGRSVYITTWYQVPTITTGLDGSKVISYNGILQLPEIGPVEETEIYSQSENNRLRFQITMDITYEVDGSPILVNDVEIRPEYVKNFSVTPMANKVKEYVVSNKSYETYGHIEKRIEFEDVNSSQELLDRAKKYLNASQFDEMSLKLKALDMTILGYDVDNMNLYVADAINVSSPPHGVYRDFIIRTMSIPFDKPEDTTFELGWDNKDSLAKLIRKEKSKW